MIKVNIRKKALHIMDRALNIMRRAPDDVMTRGLDFLKVGYSAKETYNLIDPTNRSHHTVA